MPSFSVCQFIYPSFSAIVCLSIQLAGCLSAARLHVCFTCTKYLDMGTDEAINLSVCLSVCACLCDCLSVYVFLCALIFGLCVSSSVSICLPCLCWCHSAPFFNLRINLFLKVLHWKWSLIKGYFLSNKSDELALYDISTFILSLSSLICR